MTEVEFHECSNPCPDHPNDKNHEHCDWCKAIRESAPWAFEDKEATE